MTLKHKPGCRHSALLLEELAPNSSLPFLVMCSPAYGGCGAWSELSRPTSLIVKALPGTRSLPYRRKVE